MSGKLFSYPVDHLVLSVIVYYLIVMIFGLHALMYKGLYKDEWDFFVLFITFLIISLWMNKFKIQVNFIFATGVVFFAYYLFLVYNRNRETFENSETTEEEKTKDEKKPESTIVESSEVVELPNNSEIVEEDENKKDISTIEESAVKLNIPETVATAFSQFSPEQMRNMTKDTKELLQTQKDLTDTLKMLTPIVSQGVKLVDAFKDSSTNMDKIKSMGDIAKVFKK